MVRQLPQAKSEKLPIGIEKESFQRPRIEVTPYRPAIGECLEHIKKRRGVLEVRWAISAEEENWPEGLLVARALIQSAPKRSSGWLHQAYALRRVPEGGLKQAWDALLPVFEQFPQELLVPYNLSCYACQMGQLEDARVWLKRALLLGPKEKTKTMALQDPDLAPLWSEIPQW